MRFEWDDWKNESNRKKHGISFETATEVFYDPSFLQTEDRIVDGELRWHTIGHVAGFYLLLVVHTLVEDGEEVIRIISAREATVHERGKYEGDL